MNSRVTTYTMNSRVTTYSADEATLSIANILIDSGYAEGEFVSIEMQSDDFSDKAGADGEVARAKTNDRRATIKVKLLQTAIANNYLSALRLRDINAPNGAGVGVFQLRDRSSGVLLAKADKCWISKPPAVSRGREIVEYEWTFRAANMELDPSGNPSI
jgi:hypothetical protein